LVIASIDPVTVNQGHATRHGADGPDSIGYTMRAAPLETLDIEQALERLADWACVSVDGVMRVERTFQFDDQIRATRFTQLLGELADAANHHPSLLVQRSSVTVAWWTFSLGALTPIDLVMAERTDRLHETLSES
jgi:4a-hydroxytetrahydrobiopterin dehydratase